MSDDKQEKQAEETKSGSKSDAAHEQPFGATKPSSPGETGTTPGSDWK